MTTRPLDYDAPITCSDACHHARGSAGGTDYGTGGVEGKRVSAPFGGNVQIGHNSEAGDYLSIRRDDGVTFYAMHLKERLVTSGHVVEGADIARTGGRAGEPYSGIATGPHLHAHIVLNGRTVGFEEWYKSQSNPADFDDNPIPATQFKENDMIIYGSTEGPWYLSGNGKSVVIIDAKIAGQDITGVDSLNLLRSVLYGNVDGKFVVNQQQVNIIQFWVDKLRGD